MNMEVLEPGLLTTVQDCGRHGYRHLGVGQSGVLDSFSAAVANILVGNSPGSPLLEMTLRGPVVRFSVPVRIAICGAGIEVHRGNLALPAGWLEDHPMVLALGWQRIAVAWERHGD